MPFLPFHIAMTNFVDQLIETFWITVSLKKSIKLEEMLQSKHTFFMKYLPTFGLLYKKLEQHGRCSSNASLNCLSHLLAFSVAVLNCILYNCLFQFLPLLNPCWPSLCTGMVLISLPTGVNVCTNVEVHRKQSISLVSRSLCVSFRSGGRK